MDLLAPKPGERILDLGCGDGVLTKKLADLGCEVVAVDSSLPQIEAARKLGLNASAISGEDLPYKEQFDAALIIGHVFRRPPYSFGTRYGRNTPIQSSSNRIELKEQRLNLHRVMLRSTRPIVKGFRVPVELWPTLPYAESSPTGGIFAGLSLQPLPCV